MAMLLAVAKEANVKCMAARKPFAPQLAPFKITLVQPPHEKTTMKLVNQEAQKPCIAPTILLSCQAG